MIDCAVIGDSIALGVARNNPRCHAQAVSGITSRDHARTFVGRVSANSVLISLGSNDGDANSERYLRAVRQRIESGTVTWLLSPNNQRARSAVALIAREHGDRVIEIRPFVGSDRVHPTASGYHRISSIWRER